MAIAFWAIAAAFGALMSTGAGLDPSFPPKIFAAQFEEAFGHPPGENRPQPKPAAHRRVFITHG